jgi:hypothetical protein
MQILESHRRTAVVMWTRALFAAVRDVTAAAAKDWSV